MHFTPLLYRYPTIFDRAAACRKEELGILDVNDFWRKKLENLKSYWFCVYNTSIVVWQVIFAKKDLSSYENFSGWRKYSFSLAGKSIYIWIKISRRGVGRLGSLGNRLAIIVSYSGTLKSNPWAPNIRSWKYLQGMIIPWKVFLMQNNYSLK